MTKMVTSSLTEGLRQAGGHIRLSLFLLLVNLLFAFLLTVPFYREIMSELGRSLMGGELLKGFNYAWLAEFNYNHPDFMKTMGDFILPVTIVYVFTWSALSGGIIETFVPVSRGGKPYRFFPGMARHLLPFIRLTIISIIVYLSMYWLLMIKTWKALFDLIEDSPYPQLEFAVGVGLTLLTILLGLFFNMIFDYARIKKVMDGFPSILLSIIGAMRFCFSHLRATLSIYATLLLLSGIVIVSYLAVYRLVPQDNIAGIISLFVFQEVFMLGRIFIRVSEYSCQMVFYSRAGDRRE
jgi:hypothetical protein